MGFVHLQQISEKYHILNFPIIDIDINNCYFDLSNVSSLKFKHNIADVNIINIIKQHPATYRGPPVFVS